MNFIVNSRLEILNFKENLRILLLNKIISINNQSYRIIIGHSQQISKRRFFQKVPRNVCDVSS